MADDLRVEFSSALPHHPYLLWGEQEELQGVGESMRSDRKKRDKERRREREEIRGRSAAREPAMQPPQIPH
jgi:hypothetical protein